MCLSHPLTASSSSSLMGFSFIQAFEFYSAHASRLRGSQVPDSNQHRGAGVGHCSVKDDGSRKNGSVRDK